MGDLALLWRSDKRTLSRLSETLLDQWIQKLLRTCALTPSVLASVSTVARTQFTAPTCPKMAPLSANTSSKSSKTSEMTDFIFKRDEHTINSTEKQKIIEI